MSTWPLICRDPVCDRTQAIITPLVTTPRCSVRDFSTRQVSSSRRHELNSRQHIHIERIQIRNQQCCKDNSKVCYPPRHRVSTNLSGVTLDKHATLSRRPSVRPTTPTRPSEVELSKWLRRRLTSVVSSRDALPRNTSSVVPTPSSDPRLSFRQRLLRRSTSCSTSTSPARLLPTGHSRSRTRRAAARCGRSRAVSCRC